MAYRDTALRRTLHWSWILVIACGLILGYYFLETYVSPRTRQYQLDFGRAYWIEPAERPAPIAYFRKDIHLATGPEQAWLEIAASDNYNLTVNGHSVGTEGSVKTYETGIYDLKRALRQGTNVIAVSISRTSFPGPAQLLLRGQITQPGGKVVSVVSDESWRATNHTGIVSGAIDWNSQRVEEELWPNARISQLNGEKVPLRWVDINPLVLQLPLKGQWIMAPNSAPEAVFSTVIQADHNRQETWIQLASSGDVDFAVNDHIVTVASTAASGGKRLPHLATAEPAPVVTKPGRAAKEGLRPKKQAESPLQSVTLSAYDISRWIRRGSNQLVVAVRSDQVPAALFADGFVVKSKSDVRQFASSPNWTLGDQAGAGNGASQQHPIALGKYGVNPWGYLPQELARPLDRAGFATAFAAWLVVGLILALVLMLWLVVSALVSRWREEPLSNAMARDALLHGPVAAGLVLLLLPNYDPRFPLEWSFRPVIVVGAFAVLLLVRLLHLLADSWSPAVNHVRIEHIKTGVQWEERRMQARRFVSAKLRLPELFEIPFRQLLPCLALVLIMFLGFGLRFHDLGYMSFDHDEMGLVAKSKGVLTLGFPYTSFAGEIRWITTYEAVPYPLALAGLLFGYSEWSMRLPACLLGTLCIGIVGMMGRRLFGWRTGLFAALVYACLPLNIRWAQNAFYPTQCQFMAMLTFWLFYEAIQFRPFHRKLLTGATVAFCLMYISWEGTAFVLPALFLALMAVRWREWWWLKDFHLYRCLFFIAAVVIAQYCSRILAGVPYLQVGSGLSNLGGPSLFFLSPAYQPMFYIDKLFLSENHVFFTVMLLIGLPFCWRSRGFRYVFVLLAALFIAHTNFLAALSPRYAYYYQALLILGGVAATVMLYDRVILLAEMAGGSDVSRLAAHATGVALLALIFIQSNESVLKEYQLSSTGDTPQMMARLNTYRYDYRGAAQYVATHARPGDVVFPGIPHVFLNYAGFPGNYFMDTLFSSKVFYNQVLNDLQFADKFGGLPVVRDLRELKQVVSHSGRTWIVFAPYSSFEKLNSPAVLDYIHDNAKAEFESYRTKVYLIQAARPEKVVAQAP